MKKRNNKKGFTIVELVIVIAVIAILASVLIPTFSGIVKRAQLSAAAQEATNAYKEAYALALADDGLIQTVDETNGNVTKATQEEEIVDKFKFTFNTTNGAISSVTIALEADNKYIGKYEFTWTAGAIKAKEAGAETPTNPTT